MAIESEVPQVAIWCNSPRKHLAVFSGQLTKHLDDIDPQPYHSQLMGLEGIAAQQYQLIHDRLQE